MSVTRDPAQPATHFSIKKGLTFMKSHSVFVSIKYSGISSLVADGAKNVSVVQPFSSADSEEGFFLDKDS